MQSKQKRMDAGLLADNAIPKPSEKFYDANGDTVRPFRHKLPPMELSPLDEFLVKIGSKDMPNAKATTSPLEWNKSVLGLTATLIAVLSVLVGFVWNYAVLSTKFELQQQKQTQLESEIKDVKKDIDTIKDFKLKVDSYNLGVMDAHGGEKKTEQPKK